MKTLRTLLAVVWLSVVMAVLFTGSAFADVLYVDADATGKNNGASWENAYTFLDPALEAAVAGDEIWVAAGTYKPSAHPNIADDEMDPEEDARRYNHFSLKNNVALYGGFAGGEKTLDERDWEKNETILSGETDGQNSLHNCFHVFYHPERLHLNKTAVLDGFRVTGGFAYTSYTSDPKNHNSGGGMYNHASSPKITNCVFTMNHAYYGGAVCNQSSSPIFLKCTFYENIAIFWGGAMDNEEASPILDACIFERNVAGEMISDIPYIPMGSGGGLCNNENSSPRIINCIFTGNWAAYSGGGIANNKSSPQLVNCIFNHDRTRPFFIILPSYGPGGGAIANWMGSNPVFTNCTVGCSSEMFNFIGSSPTLVNCIFWSGITNDDDSTALISYSNIQGAFDDNGVWDDSFGVDKGGNIAEAPLFVQPPDPGPDEAWHTEDDDLGDLHLQADSPCVDAGDNEAPGLVSTDLDGNPRIVNRTVDMGAYESGAAAVAAGGGGGGGCFLSALQDG
ncbi:right-handed parallel beta-helix repeat-containing protein [Desulfosudis oleivorans]|uniref:Polymorphic membrane protein Chlamydia n=1 Tax=Desulfosudis oleivorans (strain DSM 6200 / JCM 39069 / Hxd3) TaxID=96561 RepID=A8ZSE2_DESOH|nr:right-handed parallel beta-helix repeat-containing protein [Desulfosudis oleivorans]ABW67679.1 Polymorphic membrane protein Chlamydia [Desulfosudis oleivorans Hxd3]